MLLDILDVIKNKTMKHVLIICLFITGIVACQSEIDNNTNVSEVGQERIQALARKYGVTLTLTPNGTGKDKNGKQFSSMTYGQLEKEFQAMATQKAYYEQETKQIQQMDAEFRAKKPVSPTEYFAIMDKYPMAKKAQVEQHGGIEGFTRFKNEVIEKASKEAEKQ
jgi:hypothetical protein